MINIDLYKVIGLSRNASTDDINKKCKEMLLKYHPDKSGNNDPDNIAIFELIVEAKNILTNEYSRNLYDTEMMYSYQDHLSKKTEFNNFINSQKSFESLSENEKLMLEQIHKQNFNNKHIDKISPEELAHIVENESRQRELDDMEMTENILLKEDLFNDHFENIKKTFEVDNKNIPSNIMPYDSNNYCYLNNSTKSDEINFGSQFLTCFSREALESYDFSQYVEKNNKFIDNSPESLQMDMESLIEKRKQDDNEFSKLIEKNFNNTDKILEDKDSISGSLGFIVGTESKLTGTNILNKKKLLTLEKAYNKLIQSSS